MKISPSHPFFPVINDLWDSYARSKNPQVWYNLKDVPLEYLLKAQDELISLMEVEIRLYEHRLS